VKLFSALLIACPAVITGIWTSVFAVRSQKKSVQICVISLQLIVKYYATLLLFLIALLMKTACTKTNRCHKNNSSSSYRTSLWI